MGKRSLGVGVAGNTGADDDGFEISVNNEVRDGVPPLSLGYERHRPALCETNLAEYFPQNSFDRAEQVEATKLEVSECDSLQRSLLIGLKLPQLARLLGCIPQLHHGSRHGSKLG
jgi:hypothetical protein